MNKIILNLSIMFIIIFLIPFSIAQTEILDADAATLKVSITNTINLITGSNGYVEEGKATLDWYPRETYNQEIKEQIIQPDAELINGNYIFSWERPGSQIGFSIEALLNTNTDVIPVKTKIKFPLTNVPGSIGEYTKPTEMIDLNSDIKNLAGNIAAGEDDLYKVVFNLADWVTTNIEYNLTTVTADAVYPSSWVLDHGYGVCDEMTNLFISLNRALGIPARFISGVSYTNVPGVDEWGGHGWAEVYFPDVGWVPFDVTYGEYGYVDAGHIKLNDGFDSSESSVEFSGSGGDFEIFTKPLDIDVDIIKEKQRNFDIISVNLEPYADEVSFGSYNLLILTLQNLRNYYVSTRVDLGFTTGLIHESPDKVNILLAPREKKEIYFLVKVIEDLDKDFLYSFPVAGYTKLASPAETSFDARAYGPKLTKVMFDEYFTQEQKKIAKIKIDCDSKDYYKPGKISFVCEILNQETANIYGRICVEDCEKITLKRNIPRAYEINLYRDVGTYTLPIVIKSSESSATSYVSFSIINDTGLDIEVIDYPETITFRDAGTISFLVKAPNINPTSVRASIKHEYFEQEWEEAPLENQRYMFGFKGSQIVPGNNEFIIEIVYEDIFGDEHTVNKVINVNLINLTFGERVIAYVNMFGYWLENMFNKFF